MLSTEIINPVTASYEKDKCKYGIGIANSCMEKKADYLHKILSDKIPGEKTLSINVGAVLRFSCRA